ncbi:MAG: phosphoribosylformylglycinamidine synthase I [Candidatus Eisenbacteria bacterium]|nr:phosphoribosylformylglycinamidine synthase I [Candidatus Eisenbacteria bacterium]
MSGARVAVIQFPGVNCEAETVRALERAGLGASVFRWTRPAGELRSFEAYVLPGGFSYQDRVRAGVLAAKDPLVGVLAERAEAGRPVLGICNGAQVLVEAGLVPGGGAVEVALAANRMPARSGYYTRWVTCRVEASPCLFLRHLEPGTLLPLPVAHGEGRFVSRRRGAVAALLSAGQVPLRYASAAGVPAEAFPDNPNGAEQAAAAICNPAGNVLAMMPHPERTLDLGAIARTTGGEWGRRQREALSRGGALAFADAPGTGPFLGLRAFLEQA